MRIHSLSLPLRRAATLALLLTVALCFAPSPLEAQARWTPNGVPVCVNPNCYGTNPLICSDGAGGALIAWQTEVYIDLYLQRVLHNGAIAAGWPPAGAPVTRAPGNQYPSDMVPDGQGGAFLVWYDWPSYDIYAQHVLGNGQIAPGWPADGLPVCTAPGTQYFPDLLGDGAGGIMIVWEDGRLGSSNFDIYGLHLNGDGTRVSGWPENGLGVCTATGGKGVPLTVSDAAGGFLIVWGDARNGVSDVYGQHLMPSGEIAPGWPSDGRLLIPGGDGGRSGTNLVSDGAGGAYYGWELNHGPDAYDNDVYAIRILGDGTVAPGWPAGGDPVSTRPFTQYLTSMIPDGAGGVLLAWYDNWEQPSVAFVQRLASGGAPALGWPAGGVRASDILGWQVAPRLAPDGVGGAYVAVEIGPGEGYLQHLLPDGTRAPGWPGLGIALVNDPIISYAQRELAITPDGSGGAIVAWNDSREGRQNQIYAQRFFGDGPTPVLVSLVSVEAVPDRVALTWHRGEGGLAEAVVYRRRDGEEWVALGRVSFDGGGRLRYEDREVLPGARYSYRLGWNEPGGDYFSAETWVEVPLALVFGLEGARPNPAVGPLTVAFTLARAEPATLELLDVSGRRIIARDLGNFGPGRHEIRLGECGCTPPGMYWLRLAQAGRSLVRRAVVVR
jgi:hypothetical protein